MRYANFIIIFLLALIVRLSIAMTYRDIPGYDAAGYDSYALDFLQHEAFIRPVAFKEPFYAFFLVLIYRIFGHNYLGVTIIQSFLSAFVCILVFIISRSLFNNKVGILAGFIASVNPSFIRASGLLLTETLFTFILVLAIFYCLKLDKSLNFKNLAILGLLFGVGSLTRSALVPFTVLICIILFFLLRKQYPVNKRLINIFILFICFLLPILPWTIRNWMVFHEFVPISTNTGINIYSSYFPPQGKLFGFTADDENTRLAKSLDSPLANKFLIYKTFERLKKLSFGRIFKLEFLKLLFFWVPLDWEIIGEGRYNLIYGFIMPFFIFSFIYLLRSFRQLIFLYLPILYFAAFSLITYGSPRFRMPVETFIIVFASYGIYSLWNKLQDKKLICFIFLIWLVINIGIYKNIAYIKLPIKNLFTNF